MRQPSACSQHAGGVLQAPQRRWPEQTSPAPPIPPGQGTSLSVAPLLGLDPCRDGVDDLAFDTVVSMIGKCLAWVTCRDAALEAYEFFPRRPFELSGEQPRRVVPGDDTAVLLVVNDQGGYPDLVEVRVEDCFGRLAASIRDARRQHDAVGTVLLKQSRDERGRHGALASGNEPNWNWRERPQVRDYCRHVLRVLL